MSKIDLFSDNTIIPSLLLWNVVSSSVVIDAAPKNSRLRTLSEDYDTLRAELLNETLRRSFGSDIQLTELESQANEILMEFKFAELHDGFRNLSYNAAGMHLFDAFKLINQSKVFEIIKAMPKGGVLHAHDTGMLSTEKLIEFTYKPNLWILGSIKEDPEFLFSDRKPEARNNEEWQLVSDVRKNDTKFDRFLKKKLTLIRNKPLQTYKSVDGVWEKFQKLFLLTAPIITYDGVWKEYYRETLAEYLEDGVQYLEFRGVLPSVSISFCA